MKKQLFALSISLVMCQALNAGFDAYYDPYHTDDNWDTPENNNGKEHPPLSKKDFDRMRIACQCANIAKQLAIDTAQKYVESENPLKDIIFDAEKSFVLQKHVELFQCITDWKNEGLHESVRAHITQGIMGSAGFALDLFDRVKPRKSKL